MTAVSDSASARLSILRPRISVDKVGPEPVVCAVANDLAVQFAETMPTTLGGIAAMLDYVIAYDGDYDARFPDEANDTAFPDQAAPDARRRGQTNRHLTITTLQGRSVSRAALVPPQN